MERKRIIDVSYAQGRIDWETVKKSGEVDGAIIRVGYCYNNGALKLDTAFTYNIQEAIRVGFPVGVYLFSYALTAEAARRAATEVLTQLTSYSLTLPVVFDIEDSASVKYSSFNAQLNTDMVNAFCDTVEEAGYVSAVYASKSFLEHNLYMDSIFTDVWVAQWGVPKCTYDGRVDIWQYSATGKISGITTAVDLNYLYADYGLPTQPEEEAPQTTEPPTEDGIKDADSENTYYTVMKNDNLTRIAEAHKVPLSQLIKVNPQIKNPDLIYIGETIRIPHTPK